MKVVSVPMGRSAISSAKKAALVASGCAVALAEAVEEYLETATRIGAHRDEARKALAARMATMPVHLSFDKALADVFPGLPN